MKQLILAGNRPEFEEYCRRNALVSDDAVFMETADQLKGITAGSFTFIKLENWHLNPITNTKEFWNFLSVQHPIFRDAN